MLLCSNKQLDSTALDEQIAVNEKRAKLQWEIDKLKKLVRAEKQPKKKFELVQKINELRKEAEDAAFNGSRF